MQINSAVYLAHFVHQGNHTQGHVQPGASSACAGLLRRKAALLHSKQCHTVMLCPTEEELACDLKDQLSLKDKYPLLKATASADRSVS